MNFYSSSRLFFGRDLMDREPRERNFNIRSISLLKRLPEEEKKCWEWDNSLPYIHSVLSYHSLQISTSFDVWALLKSVVYDGLNHRSRALKSLNARVLHPGPTKKTRNIGPGEIHRTRESKETSRIGNQSIFHHHSLKDLHDFLSLFCGKSKRWMRWIMH